MDQILNTQIANGTTIGDLLTLQFLASILGNVLTAILILVVGFILAGWVKRRIQGISDRDARLDKTLFTFLGGIVWYVIIGLALLIVLNTFGVQTTSIVAMVGAAGLAVGLALQGTLSNVAAGVMIILFRPFKMGDFVVVDGQMGTVKNITLNFTELASLQNIQIIVPNSNVWGNVMTSYSAYPDRRVQWEFGVAYGSDLQLARDTILNTIMADPRARAQPEPFIQVTALNDFSVDFMVRVWCANDDAWGFQTDCTRAVKEALDKAGIEIPFPTRTLFAQPVGDAAPQPLSASHPLGAAERRSSDS
ncbi:mechanosensitive ion channel family protein [Pseudoroseicyclus aestuarii]|uniref:Small-conductance mechanosensitive channel n=1 Tax=Pseudoroseicyclus aestuarii TaxID=1795041 RepID=A0A318SV17_9RHOB|nr:mechanosensitive ion channel family protein [Pseudoroseicyclus aestuarii]PYE83707.1 small conductance mechanosensitive channel [Pseudoroseicyclus aestuarii]